MTLTKVLITVKTYPTLSAKYDELVCTAGFREDGSWVRIYPIPFRKKSYDQQYKKYDWIEIDLAKNEHDFRPESYRPTNIDNEIKIVGHIGTENNWEERKKYCLKKVYEDIKILIDEAKNKDIRTSLAVFKPKEILNFYVESTEREWDTGKLENLKQLNLFDNYNKDGSLSVVKKLPYKFKFRFIDAKNYECNLMIEDWETGQLFWRCMQKYSQNEQKAIEDVRKKYFDDFAKNKDLYFFLGTTKQHHFTSKNPFIIIGTFYPKKEHQLSLF